MSLAISDWHRPCNFRMLKSRKSVAGRKKKQKVSGLPNSCKGKRIKLKQRLKENKPDSMHCASKSKRG